MNVTKIYISSFGAIRDRTVELSPGMNLLVGDNEAGKTSIAMFIKFIFYGLAQKENDAFPTGERKRFINWDTGRAEGFLEFSFADSAYRVERSLFYTGDGDKVKERVSVRDLSTLDEVKITKDVGEHFFGVPESVFVNTVFVRQLGSTVVDSGQISSAVENILGSGSERINVDKVTKKLNSVRRQLKHERGLGGELYDLECEIADLKHTLYEQSEKNREIILKQSELEGCVERIGETSERLARLERVDMIREDITALSAQDSLREKKSELEAEEKRLSEDEAAFTRDRLQTQTAQIRAELSALRSSLKNAEEELDSLRERAKADTITPGECDSVAEDAASLESRQRSGKAAGTGLLICGIVMLAAGAVCLLTDVFPFYLPAAAGGALILVAAFCFALASGKKKKLEALLRHWHVSSTEELRDVLERRKEEIYSRMAAASQTVEKERAVKEIKNQIASCMGTARELMGYFPSLSKTDTSGMTCDEVLELCDRERNRIEKELQDRRARLSELRGECIGAEKELERYDFAVIDLHVAEFAHTPQWEEAKERIVSDPKGEKLATEIAMEKKRLEIYTQTRQDCELFLAEARALVKSPAALMEQISEKEALYREKELKYEGVRLAMDALAGSGERLRKRILPRLTAEASQMFSRATDQKYVALGVSPDFGLSVSDSAVTRSVDFLSAGSADAAYVCLRLALGRMLLDRESIPLVFDESFAKIDEDRLSRLFDILSSSNEQSIVFTCRSAEKVLAKGAAVTDL